MSHLPTSAASRQTLSGALTHGFVAVLVFALVALLATFFLKDKATASAQEALSPEVVSEANEAFDKELVHA
jgi:hypothetical protein